MAGEERGEMGREERGGSVSPRPFYNLTPGDIRVPPSHGKSWNLGNHFPGLESHGK